MKGSEYAKQILTLTADQREALFEHAFFSDDVPDFIKTTPWRPVTITGADAEGRQHSLTVRASPFLAVGTDADWLLSPMRPSTLQRIADKYNSIIPTPKLVREIFKAAPVKIHYNDETLPVDSIKKYGIESPQAFVEHDALVKQHLAAWGVSGGIPASKVSPGSVLVAGHSKNVVVGPDLKADKLGIYGGYAAYPCGKSFVDGVFCQSYPSPHEEAYVDYSQGGQLVFRRAMLDGGWVDLYDVFQDPNLAYLVSSAGPFLPRFPASGKPTKSGNFGGGGGNGKEPVKPVPKTPPNPPPKSDPPGFGMTVLIGGGSALGGYLLYRWLG